MREVFFAVLNEEVSFGKCLHLRQCGATLVLGPSHAKKGMFHSIELNTKTKTLSVVENDERRHCGIIRPDRPSARFMLLLLHRHSVLRFYLQSVAILQVISSIPKRPSSDIYLTALPTYHKKHKDRLSTELNATDHLSHAKHHQRTKTSDDIDTNLSFLQSQPSCS